MTKLIAWSYSRLSNYEQCPRKYWHLSVARDITEEKGEAADYGDEVHKSFAKFFKHGIELPLHLRQYQSQLEQIAKAPGDKIVEQQIALNASFEQVEWFSKDAYLRVISDLTQHNGTHAVTWDWKTGKPPREQDFTQLELNAAVTFHLGKEIQSITMAYFWIKTKKVEPKTIKREKAADVWSALLPRVQRFQNAYAANDFPPRQNYLCRGYCPVKTCQFWEPRKKKS